MTAAIDHLHHTQPDVVAALAERGSRLTLSRNGGHFAWPRGCDVRVRKLDVVHLNVAGARIAAEIVAADSPTLNRPTRIGIPAAMPPVTDHQVGR